MPTFLKFLRSTYSTIIVPIIEAVSLWGRQNLALKDHRDTGKMSTCSYSKIINKGNFSEILRYRAQGDSDLKSYSEGSGIIKYTSATSKNAITKVCNKVLLDKIVIRVNASKCFSILADETADISGVEQVPLCVRYVELTILELREEFLRFVPTSDVIGMGLANRILDTIKKFGFDTKYLRGQGYDGAASKSGKFNGVQAHIKNTPISNLCTLLRIFINLISF